MALPKPREAAALANRPTFDSPKRRVRQATPRLLQARPFVACDGGVLEVAAKVRVAAFCRF